MENNEVKEMKKPDIVLIGEVASAKADKTASVMVERIFQHPAYRKIVKSKKKYLAHDEQNRCKPGDLVKIKLVRPLSKRKRWLVVDILSTAPAKEEVAK